MLITEKTLQHGGTKGCDVIETGSAKKIIVKIVTDEVMSCLHVDAISDI
jgi:hypothetical protein